METINSFRLPYLKSHKHQIKYLELTGQAHMENALIQMAEVQIVLDGDHAQERVRTLEKSLFQIRRATNRSIEKLQLDFENRWFLWRALLPVCSVTGLRPSMIWSDTRMRACARPRHLWLWLARVSGDLSTSHIGKLIGRDHSTVRKSCELVEAQLKTGKGDLVDILADVMEFECERS